MINRRRNVWVLVPRKRLELRDDQRLLSPPIVGAPLYQCAIAVTVYGFVPDATLDVEVAGAVAVAGAPGGFPNPIGRTITLPAALTAGQVVRGKADVRWCYKRLVGASYGTRSYGRLSCRTAPGSESEPEEAPKVKKAGRKEAASEVDIEEAEIIPAESPSVKLERPTRDKPKPAPGKPQPLGKGGRQHKYLQEMVKRLAEDKGFRATIEKPVLGGKGSVDVALEKDGRAIACEISVSTTAEWELGNIQKCLASGFEKVFLLSQEKKSLANAHELIKGSFEAPDWKKCNASPSRN